MPLKTHRPLSLALLVSFAAACAPGAARELPAQVQAAIVGPVEVAGQTAQAPAPPLVSPPVPVGGPVNVAPSAPLAATAPNQWAQSLRPTTLRSAPLVEAPALQELPAASYVKLIESRPGWVRAVYGGVSLDLPPAEAWLPVTDLGPLSNPPLWARTYVRTSLQPGSDGRFTPQVLPLWSLLEVLSEDREGRLQVRYPGDGQSAPGAGWVEAGALVPVQTPEMEQLPWAYPRSTTATVRIPVPYRSQLDDTPWADANCGPAAVGMGLAALGIDVSSTELREGVMDAQEIWGDDAGTFIWALAATVEAYGLRALDLYQNDVQKRWSAQDVRRHVEAGRPALLQVRYRALPGREEKLYWGDHYIVVTGLVDDWFLYNDPIDNDGPGYDRYMTAGELGMAMNAADRRYSYAGFAFAPRG